MEKGKYDAVDLLIAQTPVPDAMKKLKRIGVEDLVVGGHYLRFDGSLVRRIKAIEGDNIHFRDQDGAGVFEKEYFLKLHTALAPPGTELGPEDLFDEDFTIRDEADTLTALAFRNGFNEELHAGKRSPVLDQLGYSRITDDEMRRLMIEASEKLAQMLALKRSDPDKYEAKIRDYHERYCRTCKRD